MYQFRSSAHAAARRWLKSSVSGAALTAALLFSLSGNLHADEAELGETVKLLEDQLRVLQEQNDAKVRAIVQLQQVVQVLQSEIANLKGVTAPATRQHPPMAASPSQHSRQANVNTPPAPPAPPPVERSEPQEEQVADAAPATAADVPRKKKADPSAAVESIVREEHGLFGDGILTIEPGITYASFDRSVLNLSGFLALDAIFLGNISVDQVVSHSLTGDTTVRLALGDRLQVHGTVPYVYRSSNFQSAGGGGSSAVQLEDQVDTHELGDVSFGGSFRAFQETGLMPDIVLSAIVQAPTGTDPFGIEVREVTGSQGNLTVPTELPTGNGVWAYSGGLSVLKTIDPAVLFSNVLYTYRQENDFDDISAATGDQPGSVNLGDSLDFGAGVAFALSDRLSLSMSYSQRFIFKTRLKALGAAEPSSIIGSDANISMLNMGITWAPTNAMTIVTNVGAGLSEDAPDVQLTLKVPFQFSW